MRSPMYALVWEQWRQVRLVALCGIAATAVASIGLRFIVRASAGPDLVENAARLRAVTEEWASGSTAVAAIALILLGAALLFSHSSPRSLRMGLPPRILNLPVSTFRLASAQFGFRIGTIGSFALAHGLALALVDIAYAPLVVPLVATAVFCYTYASAIATSIGVRSPVAASIVIVVTAGPVAAVPYVASSDLAHTPGPAIATYFLLLTVFAAVTFLRFAGIRSVPSGERMLRPRTRLRLWRRARPGQMGIEGFRVEWRRMGWIVPSFAGAVFLISAVPFVLSGFDNAGLWGYEMLILYVPCSAGFILGMAIIARDHRDSVTGVARYTWTRPTTVQQAVLDRMKAAGLSMALTFCVPLAMFALSVDFGGYPPTLGAFESVFVAAVAYLGVMMLAWLIVWAPYIPLAHFVYLSIYAALHDALRWRFDEYYATVLVPGLAYWVVFGLLAHASWKRRLFSVPTVAAFSGFGVLCCLITFWCLSRLVRIDDRQWNEPAILIAVAAGAFAPMTSLLAHGVLLDRLRHGALTRGLPRRRSRLARHSAALY